MEIGMNGVEAHCIKHAISKRKFSLSRPLRRIGELAVLTPALDGG
jgi:hypothetical protein